VRRDGTMVMSSKANACCARLLRPISNMWVLSPYWSAVAVRGGWDQPA
jgi:hypothetical protein